MGRDTKDRLRIAQVAAKLIAEHGMADWTAAKRKAARQLMLPEREALPGDDEVTAALAEYHALFGGEAHTLRLREQRELAVRWMRRLADFTPALTGGVAEGWATEHSDVRLELTAADAKLVEIALLNAGVGYRAMHADRDGAAELYVDTPGGGLRLSVRTPADAHQRPRRDRHGRDEVRLDVDAVLALLQ
ncbi:MAG: UDP-N-acetylmuramate--alanine ligase [Burkholderiales bacterium]|nr:UDP-N-acetylmuramate--alanine ligase [Burkholderiales bacterium]